MPSLLKGGTSETGDPRRHHSGTLEWDVERAAEGD
jgi:hypothetical protein